MTVARSAMSASEPADLGTSSAAGRDEPRGQWSLGLGSRAAIEHWRGVEDEQAWRRVRGQAIAPTSSSFSRKPSMVTGVARSRQRLLHARIVLHHLNSWIACRRVPGTKVLLAGDQWQWRPPPQASIIGSVGGWPVRGGAG
jgi:hypothetical protein